MALIICKDCGNKISKRALSCPSCGAAAKKKTSLATWFFTVIFGYIFFVFLFSDGIGHKPVTNTSNNTTASNSTNISNKDKDVLLKKDALKNITLNFSWSKGGFDSMMVSDFVIENKNRNEIRDVEIKCDSFANSGTRIDTNIRTIYEVIPAKGTLSINKFNMGFLHSQATSTSCYIIDFSL